MKLSYIIIHIYWINFQETKKIMEIDLDIASENQVQESKILDISYPIIEDQFNSEMFSTSCFKFIESKFLKNTLPRLFLYFSCLDAQHKEKEKIMFNNKFLLGIFSYFLPMAPLLNHNLALFLGNHYSVTKTMHLLTKDPHVTNLNGSTKKVGINTVVSDKNDSNLEVVLIHDIRFSYMRYLYQNMKRRNIFESYWDKSHLAKSSSKESDDSMIIRSFEKIRNPNKPYIHVFDISVVYDENILNADILFSNDDIKGLQDAGRTPTMRQIVYKNHEGVLHHMTAEESNFYRDGNLAKVSGNAVENWLKINVTYILLRLHGKKPSRFVFDVKDASQRFNHTMAPLDIESTLVIISDKTSHEMPIFAYAVKGVANRRKRSIIREIPKIFNDTNSKINNMFQSQSRLDEENYLAEQAETLCQRYDMTVDFETLGFLDEDYWIIAPTKYNAYYCEGGCHPRYLGLDLNPTNHATLQGLLYDIQNSHEREDNQPLSDEHRYRVEKGDLKESNSSERNSGVRASERVISDDVRPPLPCCVPNHLEPLTVLYYDKQRNVVLKRFTDMIASNCGCQ
ncbi:growth/differentiation factor 2-like isoform X2 [Gordionus sp. m RMFG-2023]|uniref:growth/differentiation factor 2-like isoform X2 n=1 Tax=Gordionus sp. m RMFG-2023 TaxID=3053472 RepID=UPI0031FD2D48